MAQHSSQCFTVERYDADALHCFGSEAAIIIIYPFALHTPLAVHESPFVVGITHSHDSLILVPILLSSV